MLVRLTYGFVKSQKLQKIEAGRGTVLNFFDHRKKLLEVFSPGSNVRFNMSLTEREGCLELRARYLRLVAALRRTQEQNPETLKAVERIAEPDAGSQRTQLPFAVSGPDQRDAPRQYAA